MSDPLALSSGWAVAKALGLATPAVSLALYGSFVPTSQFWGPVVTRAASASRAVALTFDDGPFPGSTEAILDILAANKVAATFFVIGRNVERWPDLARRMVAEGHLLANHSLDHHRLGVFGTFGYWRRQLSSTTELIQGIAGERPVFFRPPMGFTTWPVCNAARRGNMILVNWTRRAFDGLAHAGSSEAILGRLLPARCR